MAKKNDLHLKYGVSLLFIVAAVVAFIKSNWITTWILVVILSMIDSLVMRSEEPLWTNQK